MLDGPRWIRVAAVASAWCAALAAMLLPAPAWGAVQVHADAADATPPASRPADTQPADTQPAATTIQPAVPGPASTQPATEPATTQPATTQPTTAPAFPPVDELLRALSSADWHERRRAQETLVRGGESARPFIEELIRRADDVEARKGAEAALAQIGQNKIVGASYITLHMKDAAPRDVIAELSRQCFAPLPTWPDNMWDQGPWGKVTVDVDHKPFWEVMPQVCQQLGIDFRPFQSGMRLMRTGGVQMQGVSHVDGPFLLVANQVSYTRTRMFGNQNEQSQFGINLSVYAEPKLTVLRGSGSVALDEALDDRGNSLVPPSAPNRSMFNGYLGFGGWTIYVPLQYPKKNLGSRIVRLKGNTTFILQTKVERLQIPDLMNLKQTTRLVHGVQVTFESMKKVEDTFQLRLKVMQPNFSTPQWQELMDGLQTRLQVLDGSGNALDHRGMSSSGDNNAVEITLDFGRNARPGGGMPGEPGKLVWDVPTETRDVNVPIEFKDLPLFDEK